MTQTTATPKTQRIVWLLLPALLAGLFLWGSVHMATAETTLPASEAQRQGEVVQAEGASLVTVMEESVAMASAEAAVEEEAESATAEMVAEEVDNSTTVLSPKKVPLNHVTSLYEDLDEDWEAFWGSGHPDADWYIFSDHTSVRQTTNNIHPSFFVTKDEYENIIFQTKFTSFGNDDDYIGLVFGYQVPTSTTPNDYQFILFDWKQNSDSVCGDYIVGGDTIEDTLYSSLEGFTLAQVDGVFSSSEECENPGWAGTDEWYWDRFWSHDTSDINVLDDFYHGGRGWDKNEPYTLTVMYVQDRIQVYVDGGSSYVFDNEKIFDVKGEFLKGRLGFYTFSQAVDFSDVLIIPASAILDRMVWNSDKECPICSVQDAKTFAGGPIDTDNGNLSYQEIDMAIPVRGGDLSLHRSYASGSIDFYTNTLGYGWTHNFDMRLHFNNNYFANSIELQASGGSRLPFLISPTTGITVYTPYNGVTAQLEVVTDTIYTQTEYILTSFNQMTYTFDYAGLLLQQADPSGNIITFTHNVTGLVTHVQQDTRALTYTYNITNQLTQVTDHTGRHVDLVYSGNGDLIKVINTLGLTTTYEYSGNTHLLTKVTDPSGRVVEETTYDEQGRAVFQKNGEGNEVVNIDFSSPTGHVITENGLVMTHTYDYRNTLISIDYACADDIVGCQTPTSLGYDRNFKITDTVDAKDNHTTMMWSENGSNLEQVVDALVHTTTLQYDELNNLTQIVNARGYTTTYGYENSNYPTFRTAMTDTLGHVTLYTPTTEGWLQAQEDANGTVTAYTYNEYGQVTQMVAASGITEALTTTYSYDDLGRLITTTQVWAGEPHFTSLNVYDEGDRLVATIQSWTGSDATNWQADCQTSGSVRDTNICTQYGYDGAGRLISTTNTLGQTNLTFYDEAGRVVTSVVNYDGTTTPSSLCTDFSDPDPEYNICSLVSYDEVGRVVSTTDSLGRINQTDYDPLGRVSRSIRHVVNTPTDSYPFSCAFRTTAGSAVDEDICTLYEYDAVGNTIIVTDTAGRMNRTFYDELNRVKATVTNWTNDIASLADCTFPPAEADTNLCTVYEYDELGNTTVVTNSLGQRSRTFYDELNRVSATVQNWQGTLTDPANCNVSASNLDDEDICTLYGYDEMGNVITTTNALSQTTLMVYDALNRLMISVQNWDETTVIDERADCSFSPTETDTNLCHITVYYKGSGQKGVVYDPMGIPTVYDYDDSGRLYRTFVFQDMPGNWYIVYHEHDALGNLLYYVEEVNDSIPSHQNQERIVQYGYDSLNRVHTTTTPEWRTITQTYDAASRVITVTDGLNHSIGTTYDGLNRVVATTDALGNMTTYEYDIFGNQIVLTDALGVRTAYAYDALNRLLSVTENEDPSTTATSAITNVLTIYTYDALGNQLVITNALGYTHTTTLYDDLNRPVLITNGLGYTTTLGYDALGNRVQIMDANGVSTTYHYDGVNRVTDVTYHGDGEVVSYTYDAMGNTLLMTDTVGTTHYEYNARYDLVKVVTPYSETIEYAYTWAGNVDAIHFDYSGTGGEGVQFFDWDKDNQLRSMRYYELSSWTSRVHQSYGYDAANRLTTVTTSNNDASIAFKTFYTYDDANRLIALTHTDWYGGLLAEYEYELDAMGNRIAVTETQVLPFDTGGVAFLPMGNTAEEILADRLTPLEDPKSISGKPLFSPAIEMPTLVINPLAYTSILNMEGEVAHLELSIRKQALTADGRDYTSFTVVATTETGSPVPDGTPIYLEGKGINLPQWAFVTIDGEVHGVLISGEQAGIARLTARAEGAMDSLTLTLVPSETPLLDQPIQEQPEVPFDAQEIVEASRNQIDTSGDTPTIRRPDHTATFVADGVAFVPQVAGNTESLVVTLESFHVGNRVLPLNISPAAPTIEGHVARLERGNRVVEEFVARDAGIEQRWWLATSPENRGDLRLTLSIDTPFLLAEESGSDGYLFTLLDGTPAVRYGQATAIDAVGHSKRAQMSITNQRWDEENRQWHYEVTIRVPADWLAQATFPLLIDPLIGNPHYTSEGSGNQAQPAIAYNSTNDEYMVVWQDSREGTPQLYGQVVNNYHYDPDSNFAITADAYTHTLPALAYNADANEYLVVWEKNETDILGQRLSRTGTTLSSTLTIASTDAGTPDVAYSPAAERWLATWSETNAGNTQIYARSVYTDNTLGSLITVSSSGDDTQPTIAANEDGGYLIAWQQGVTEISGTLDIAARRVTTATTDGSIYMMTISRTQQTPDLTFNPDRNEYFLVWQTLNDASGYDTIYGRQGQVSGSLWVTDSVQIRDNADASAPAVSYTADEKYLVAWTELGSGGQTEIMGQQVLSTAVTSGDVISILIEAENQLDVALASGSTEVLLAWTDNRHPTEDVYARFWQLDGEMEGDFRIHPTAGDQYLPDVTYNINEDEYLVVWTHYETPSNPNIYAQRVSGAGVLMSGHITVAATSSQETEPAVGYSPAEDVYLVAWRVVSPSISTDINAQLIESTGTITGTTLTDLDGLTSGNADMGDVVYNSTQRQFLVVWEAADTGASQQDIWARHISPTGVAATELITITTDGTQWKDTPRVAYNADEDEYLVVWTVNMSDLDVYGRRITGEGVVITTNLAIMTDTHDQLQPEVVYESEARQYLVVAASDPDNDAKYDIVGQVVSYTGTLVGDVITISGDVNNEVQPAIALDGDGSAMVVWRRWQGSSTPDKTMYDLFGRRLTGKGVLLDDIFEVLSVGQDQTQPALAGDGYENYLLAWQDERSGGKDVYVSLFQALQAQFSISPTLGEEGEPIQFTDTSLPADMIDEWLWDFGDGSSTITSQHPSHTYSSQGIYTATLTITDTETGEIDTWSYFVRVGTITVTHITYEYDALYRLTKATYTGANEATYEYVYDAVGNMTTYTDTVEGDVTRVNRTFNRGNQLVTANDLDVGTSSFYYDNNGNLIKVIPPMMTDTFTLYGYNQRNLMITSTEVATGVHTLVVEFIYDGSGNRVRQIDHTTNVTTTYTLDIARGLPHVLLADDGTDRTVNVIGLDLILQSDGTDDRVLLSDGLGSVRMELLGLAVQTVTTYEPFGNLLSQRGTNGTVYGFTGEQNDSVTGMLYLRARYYNPQHRVFMSVDPYPGTMTSPASQHPYSYVHNNPVNFTDPSGKCIGFLGGIDTFICASIIGGAAIGGITAATWELMVNQGKGGLHLQYGLDDFWCDVDWSRVALSGGFGGLLGALLGGSASAGPTALSHLAHLARTAPATLNTKLGLGLLSAQAGLRSLAESYPRLTQWGGRAIAGLNIVDNVSTLRNAWRGDPSDLILETALGPLSWFDDIEDGTRAIMKYGDDAVEDFSELIYKYCSFSANTLVSTENGLVPISELELGDLVLGFNEFSGDVGYYPITAVWEHVDPMLVYLIIDGEVVITTPEHPFYTGEGEWLPAGALFTGDTIRTGEWDIGTVELVVFIKQSQVMYNLTVDTAHTFFVGDGQWLVHNTCDVDGIASYAIVHHKFEFKEIGINTVSELKNHIDDILTFPTEVRKLGDGTTAYWYERTGTVLIDNPNDVINGGSVFRPTDGYDYYDNAFGRKRGRRW